jgi:DNA repair ATPase RecN
MQDNIKIRNLYVEKVKNKINKLIHSISLLNNLNNIINDQKGGSQDVLDDAKNTLKQHSVVHDSINISSISSAADNSIADLTNTIDILTKHIKELESKLKSTTNPDVGNEINEQITELNKKIEELTKELDIKKAELDIRNKELEEIQEKTSEYDKILKEYNRILEELKKKLPQISNSEISKFNNIIDKLIGTLDDPNTILNNISTKSIQNKIRSKFNSVFNSSVIYSMAILKQEAFSLKINDGPNINSNQIPITPYVTKNQEEENAINELVRQHNSRYNTFIDKNTNIINDLNTFLFQYNRVNNVMSPQKITKALHEKFDDFNTYFNVTEDDLT